MYVAILDDSAERVDAMRNVLEREHGSYSFVFFDNAPEMIEWLAAHLEEVALVSLDHDLGPNRDRNGEVFDPGTGRDVTKFLLSRAPSCRVIVHSSNPQDAFAMLEELRDAGWGAQRVIPFGAFEWIEVSWGECVARCLESHALGEPIIDREETRSDETETPLIRFVRDRVAICGLAGIGTPDAFRQRGFQAHLQCADSFDFWIRELCDVLAAPFIDGLPIPDELFDRARSWFVPKWRAGEKILISCAAGQSRSICMTTALLAAAEGTSFRSALDDVLHAVPDAYPHPITLASAARLVGATLTFDDLVSIYKEIDHRSRFPWSYELLRSAATADVGE